MEEQDQLSRGPFLNNTLNAVSSDRNSAIHTNKPFPELQLSAAKAPLSLLVPFAPGYHPVQHDRLWGFEQFDFQIIKNAAPEPGPGS